MKKLLAVLGVICLLSVGSAPAGVFGVKGAEGETDFGARDICQKSHVRYDVTAQSIPSGTDVGTNYQQNPMPDLFNDEASFLRFLFDAPAAGTYMIGITRVSDAYPVRLYVNGELQIEGDLGTTNWNIKRDDYPVTLAEGINVVILQINNWGGLITFTLPNALSIIKHDESDGIYYSVDAKLNTTKIIVNPNSAKSIHEFDAPVIPVPFEYDDDPEYNGYAEYKITPKTTTKSLKVHYYSTDFSTGAGTGIMVSVNDNAAQFVALPTGEVNTALEAVLDVSALGFNFENENKVVVSVDTNNSRKLGVTALELCDEAPPTPIITNPTPAETLKTKVLLRGRQFAKANAIVMDWSASGFDVDVSGTRVIDAVFNAPNGARIATSVNKKRAALVNVPAGNNVKVRLADHINPLETTSVRIYKASEAAGSLCEMISLDLEAGAVLNKPAAKELNFFFLGSSTSCGNQIDIDKNIDAYGAFPRVLADAYNAHFDVVSCSGRGLMQGYNSELGWAASQENQLKHLFEKTSHFRDNNVLYDHSLVDYDVVVLSIGHNDLGVAIMETFGTTIDDFTAEVKAFHNRVRGLHPNAYILYEYGHYVNRRFYPEFNRVIEEIAMTDANIGFVYTHLYGAGADEHPSYSQHESIAKDLSPKVASFLGVENPMLPTPVRYEAEDYGIAGDAIKQWDDDPSTPWSEGGYVGELGPDVEITDPNDISYGGTDVKILIFTVDIPVAGKYRFTVGYATQVDSATAYVNFDKKGWHKLELFNTRGWKSMQETEFIEINLSAGEHKVYLTGSCELDSWVNYDYIELGFMGKATTFSVYKEDSDHYSFVDLPDEIIAGEDLAFKINLHSHYSKSNIFVKVNGTYVTPVNGVYHVENVQEDLYIVVEGVVINTFVLTFKDGTHILSQTTYAVGEQIVVPEDPKKQGYTFNGWDRPIPETMPNGDLTINALWIEGEVEPEIPPQDNKKLKLALAIGIPSAAVAGAGIGLGLWFGRKKKMVA